MAVCLNPSFVLLPVVLLLLLVLDVLGLVLMLRLPLGVALTSVCDDEFSIPSIVVCIRIGPTSIATGANGALDVAIAAIAAIAAVAAITATTAIATIAVSVPSSASLRHHECSGNLSS